MNARRSLAGMIAALFAVGCLFAITAASASAVSKLCKVKEVNCKVVNMWNANTVFKGEATDTKVTIEPIIEGKFVLIEITCTGSVLKAKTTANEGAQVPANGETLTFAGCSSKQAETCSVAAVNQNFAGGFIGSPTGSGTFETNIVLVIKCAKPKVECTFAAGGAMQAIGGNPGSLQAAATLELIANGSENCPSVASWTGKYVLSEPKPIWFTE